MEARLRPFAARATLLVASTLLAFALVELGLRASDAYGGHAHSVAPTGSPYKFYRFDPVLGWANAPGMHGTYERDEFRFPIRINEDGMREAPASREPERGPGARRRIAVLGDSFTWGIGVADEDRFTERLERDRGVEVLNFGVSGYAPIQYALMIDDVMAFSPDVVVVAFCLGNDFADNVLFERYGYYKPWAELDEAGALVIQGYPLPNVDDFGHRERTGGLVLLRMLRSTLARRFFLPPQRGLIDFDEDVLYHPEMFAPEARALAERAIAIDEALLRRVRDAVVARGAALALLPVPTKCEYVSPCRPGGEHVVRDGPHRILAEAAARLGVAFVPTLDALTLDDFWREDGHWRPSGHARIAERLAAGLERAGLLGAAALRQETSPDRQPDEDRQSGERPGAPSLEDRAAQHDEARHVDHLDRDREDEEAHQIEIGDGEDHVLEEVRDSGREPDQRDEERFVERGFEARNAVAPARDEGFERRAEEALRGAVEDQVADDEGSSDPGEGRTDAVDDARGEIEDADRNRQERRDDEGREEEQRRRTAQTFEGCRGPGRERAVACAARTRAPVDRGSEGCARGNEQQSDRRADRARADAGCESPLAALR